MSAERYVVLGLAHVRSTWNPEVARWSTSGAVPVEYVKCISAAELRARVTSGRRFSAALLDGNLSVVDRDLIATLCDAAIAPLVVGGSPGTDWVSLGAAGALADPLERPALLDALVTHARLLGSASIDGIDAPASSDLAMTWRGRLVAVTGRPGSGRSTMAATIAQGVAQDPRYSGDVVLADLARNAHQAVLHDARDVVPSIQELVEAHRTGRPTIAQHRELTFDVAHRGYRLLLGLRRPRDWVVIRSTAFRSSLDGLRRSARIVVADVDGDLEGEPETGSFDIEDRNLMARTTVGSADLVVVVATPTVAGIHGLIGQLDELRAFGVDPERTLVLVNRAPKGARARAELTRALADLSGGSDLDDPYLGPVFVAERRGVEAMHRDLARFPAAMVDPPGAAIRALLDRLPASPLADAAHEPAPVAVGSLGTWGEETIT